MKTQGHHSVDSMTKREDFAKAAMQAVIVSERQRPLEDQLSPGGLARDAVNLADKLIAALNEEPRR